jgi:hypothetical protein
MGGSNPNTASNLPASSYNSGKRDRIHMMHSLPPRSAGGTCVE